MAEEFLHDRKRALEEEFFRKQEQATLERLRTAHAQQTAHDALAQASGLTDPAIVDTLIRLGIHADTVLAMRLVPLVVVAWADGKLEDKERQAIVAALGAASIAADSPAEHLVQSWLTSAPPASLLDAWKAYTAGLCASLSPAERDSLRTSILGRARAVAEVAGGFLGLGSKISTTEEAMLQRLEGTFTG